MRLLALSALLAIPAAPVCALEPDDISELSDDFDDARRLGEWRHLAREQRLKADPLESFDLGESLRGRITMRPRASAWHRDRIGPLVFKEVAGDFIATVKVKARSRDGQSAPLSPSSLAGLMIRAPRAVSPRSRKPGGENHVLMAVGSVDKPAEFQLETKATRGGVSRSWLAGAESGDAVFRIARIGRTLILLVNSSRGGWAVERRLRRPDLPNTLQVGMICQSDGDPDLLAEFDYFHFRRPKLPTKLVGKDLANWATVTDAELIRLLGKD